MSSGASASASLSTPSPLTFSSVLHMTKHSHIDQPWEDDWQVWRPQAQGGSSITGLELNPAVLNHDQLYMPASDQLWLEPRQDSKRGIHDHRSSSESPAEGRPQPRSPVCRDRESLSVLQLSALSHPRATISAPHSSSSDPRPGIGAESRSSQFFAVGVSQPRRASSAQERFCTS